MGKEIYTGKIISIDKESVTVELNDGIKRVFTYPILFEGLKVNDTFKMDIVREGNAIETKITKTNFPINDEVMNKIIRKKVIWTEIKAKEQEYVRLNLQIRELEQAKKDVSFEIQKRIDESQNIAEWLDEKEYESLMADKK